MESLSLLHRAWRLLPAGPRRAAYARAQVLLAPRPDFPPPPARGGIVIAGEINRGSGLGEMARALRAALDAAGVRTWTLDLGVPYPGEPPPAPPPADVPDGAPLVLAVNAPLVPWAMRKLPRSLRRGRRVIGYWAWELPVAPPSWRVALPFVHEIWGISRFTTDALRGLAGGLPVRAVPIPVTPPLPAPLGRAALGLPRDAVVVLVSFSLASSFARKNPAGAIAAFRRAFGDRPDRLLVIKAGNPADFPEALAELEKAVAGAANIRIDTRALPTAENLALTRAADIVLSLHRAEGFGLVPAEAMLLGRAVVATGWSATMEFMDDASAALVRYRMVPARDPRGVFEAPGAMWAEPDIDDAAAQLRRLADDPAARAALGARAQVHARARLDDAGVRAAVRALGL